MATWDKFIITITKTAVYLTAVLRLRSDFFRFRIWSPDPILNIEIRIRILLRNVFDVKLKIFFVWHFLNYCKHLMTLKIKDIQIILMKLYFIQLYITRILELQGSFCG